MFANSLTKENGSLVIPIYLTKEQRIARVPLEDYVAGVVAAEMPIDFALEALKAQAIAARTYIIRRIVEQDLSNMPTFKNAGEANDPKNAWVTDTIAHQVYITDEQLHKSWGESSYEKNRSKIKRAIEETKGMILTYENKPINATFFSTSNGYTENSEDYWGVYVPYLRSVPSPWDKQISPKWTQKITMSNKTFLQKLGLNDNLTASTTTTAMSRIQRTEGNRVQKIRIGGKFFTGREVREKLALPSSQFQWKVIGSNVEITTIGYGHGVGMSQWGANGMALAGLSAETILKHYYTGIEIQQDTFLKDKL